MAGFCVFMALPTSINEKRKCSSHLVPVSQLLNGHLSLRLMELCVNFKLSAESVLVASACEVKN